MPGSSADVKLVSNAMANATRRKIMAMLVESNRIRVEISKFVGPSPGLGTLRRSGLR